MTSEHVHRTSWHIILGLSLFTLLLASGATALALLGKFTPSPDGDEGAAAHLFQLSVVLLVPTGLAFLGTTDRHRPWQVARRPAFPAVHHLTGR